MSSVEDAAGAHQAPAKATGGDSLGQPSAISRQTVSAILEDDFADGIEVNEETNGGETPHDTGASAQLSAALRLDFIGGAGQGNAEEDKLGSSSVSSAGMGHGACQSSSSGSRRRRSSGSDQQSSKNGLLTSPLLAQAALDLGGLASPSPSPGAASKIRLPLTCGRATGSRSSSMTFIPMGKRRYSEPYGTEALGLSPARRATLPVDTGMRGEICLRPLSRRPTLQPGAFVVPPAPEHPDVKEPRTPDGSHSAPTTSGIVEASPRKSGFGGRTSRCYTEPAPHCEDLAHDDTPSKDRETPTSREERAASRASSSGKVSSMAQVADGSESQRERYASEKSYRTSSPRSEKGQPRRFSWAIADGMESELVAMRLRQHRRPSSSNNKLGVQPNVPESEIERLQAALFGNCLLAGFGKDEVDELIAKAELYHFEAGSEVVKYGEFGTHLFIVASGRYRRLIPSDDDGNNQGGAESHADRADAPRSEGDASLEAAALPELGPGDVFGEAQLVYNMDVCRHWMTVRAETEGYCWAVERAVFERTMKRALLRNHLEILSLLEHVRLLRYILPQQRNELVKHLVVQIIPPGRKLTTQGLEDHMHSIFIIKSGSLAVKVGDKEVAKVERGDHLGERSFLYGLPRSATLLAIEKSEAIRVPIELLRQVLGKSFEHALWQNVVFVSLRNYVKVHGQPFDFNIDNIHRLAAQFLIKDLPPGVRVEESEAGGLRYVVVLNGMVFVRKRDDENGRLLHPGDCFGDEYVTNVSLPFQHIIENGSVDCPCKLAMLSADSLMAWSAVKAQENLTHAQKMALVRKVYVFRHLSNHHCNVIAKSFRTIIKRQSEKVIAEGELGSEFFVINAGELVVSIKGRTLRTLGVSDYFGERGLLYNEPRTATVKVSSVEAELMVISKAVFMQVVEEEMLAHLEERIVLQNTDVNFDDLAVIKIVGRGAFGVVKLVEHKTRKSRYALKCISKAEAVKNHQQENLRLEREILLENDHPFIVKVVRTFKDQCYVYFLTELVSGGELYDSIRVIGFLTKPQAQFYTGSLMLALESLHERNIVYRDLKPENVMLDSQGYVKLIDFGCAVKLREGSLLSSIVGTPHYMAPEVILGSGYGKTCDVWSLGVCLFEFICGPTPFGSDVDDTMEVFREILQGKLKFPHFVDEPTTKDVIRRLLQRDNTTRLGCCGGWPALMKHLYFRDFSFDRLLSRKLPPPLVPDVSSILEPQESRQASAEDEDDAPHKESKSGLSSSSGLSDSSDEEAAEKKKKVAQQSATAWDKDF